MYPYNIDSQMESSSITEKEYQALNLNAEQSEQNQFAQAVPPPPSQYPPPPPMPQYPSPAKPSPYPPPRPDHKPYPVKPDERLLRMIEAGIEDEKKMSEYYLKLMQMFRNPNDMELIRHMRMDSLKHVKILGELYNNVAGKRGAIKITQTEDNTTEIQSMQNLPDTLSRDIMNVINSCDYYRKLYVSFLNVEIRDMLYELVCDKHSHAIKLTYLFAKYK